MRSLIVLTLILALFSCTPPKSKILIIGDSISIGYTPFVKDKLDAQAEVHHNPGNAQHTGTGLKHIETWLSDEDWDIIQFNWGLWDLCYRRPVSEGEGKKDKINGRINYTIEEYAANLDSLVQVIQRHTSAQLIFLTTSYVPPNEPGRYPHDPIRYNDVAKTIMSDHGILVHDIYVSSMQIHENLGMGIKDVHYTEAGYAELGELVASFLETEIAEAR